MSNRYEASVAKVVEATKQMAEAHTKGNKMRRAVTLFDLRQAVYAWKAELDKTINGGNNDNYQAGTKEAVRKTDPII
jgi:hypothetical protein